MSRVGNYRVTPNMPQPEPGDTYADSRRRGIPKGNGITFPRWLLFPSGVFFMLFGLFGPKYRRQLEGLVNINRARSFGFLGFGVLLTWIAGTWSVNARRTSTGVLGWLLTALATLRFGRRAVGAPGLRAFESLIYLLFGASFLAAAYWPRPFDYRD